MSDTTEAAQTLETEQPGGSDLLSRIPRLGILSWSFVGFVVASIIVLFAFGAVSEIALPMVFAAVLAVMFKPFVGVLQRHKLKPSLAAGLVVLGLLALMVGVVVATARGVVDQADEIGESADAAVSKAADQTDELGIDEQALDDVRKAVEDAEPMVTTGVLPGVVSGIGTIVAVAGGVILGSLIMYYLLKDGTRLRRSLVAQVSRSTGRRWTRSSAARAGSCATTAGAERSCRRSCRWRSA